MGKASVIVDFKFPDFEKALNDNFERIEYAIASTIQTQVGLRFDAEGAYNGHEKWAPLKMRQGQILSLRGDLRKSIAPPQADGKAGPMGFVNAKGSISDLLVEVGTKLIYASVHNNGAIIRPKQKKALRFLNPGTGKFQFASEVSIPKRNFTDLNQMDNDELNETLVNVVQDILEKAV